MDVNLTRYQLPRADTTLRSAGGGFLQSLRCWGRQEYRPFLLNMAFCLTEVTANLVLGEKMKRWNFLPVCPWDWLMGWVLSERKGLQRLDSG